jgi:Zn-finger nucleic acid-binding protein
MEKVTYGEITVDRCTNCHGIWFDMREHVHLKEREGAESIEMGTVKDGALFNKKGDVECPVCHSQMIRMVDAGQPHIWYESCHTCYGVFFDAGEFADYKEKNLADFFKDLVVKERK